MMDMEKKVQEWLEKVEKDAPKQEETKKEETEEVEIDKKCSKCGTYLPATPEYFYRDKNRKDGMDSWCKICTKAYHKNKRQATKTTADETPKAE